MEDPNLDDLTLDDGSTIGVVGGGPSGTFFTFFALEFARMVGLKISIDILEAKDFTKPGPAGCNNCGGIVSESLIQVLSTEGIILPSTVIRRGIESYTLHVENGVSVIETPFKEQRIASVYRGAGPKGDADNDQLSFDNYLLELCKENGANVIHERVTEVERAKDGIIIRTKNSFEKKYDFVVGAVGLNKPTCKLFQSICPSYIPPKTSRTYISEFLLGRDAIDEYFGNSMHVFLLNIPNITFGALIPKGKYVTLVLLGTDIDKEIVSRFIQSKDVRNCFPPDIDLEANMQCNCYPMINIQAAKTAYSDRVVLIGDSSSSKLYKNGIGAAYVTAKAAATSAIFHGISSRTFKSSFQPACSDLDKDNTVGKFIFLVTSIIQKSRILKSGLLQMVVKEQKKPAKQRRMSSILWDTFTGSASYRNIFVRFLNPFVIIYLIWNILTAGLIKLKPGKHED